MARPSASRHGSVGLVGVLAVRYVGLVHVEQGELLAVAHDELLSVQHEDAGHGGVGHGCWDVG